MLLWYSIGRKGAGIRMCIFCISVSVVSIMSFRINCGVMLVCN